MYVFNESTTPSPDAEHAKVFEVVRGDDTPRAGVRPRPHHSGRRRDRRRPGRHLRAREDDDRRRRLRQHRLGEHQPPRALPRRRDQPVQPPAAAEGDRATNPVAALRRRLWAEMLDLPLATAGPLLADPRAAARLFDRSLLCGNRFVDIDAYPTHLMYDATGGDGIVADPVPAGAARRVRDRRPREDVRRCRRPDQRCRGRLMPPATQTLFDLFGDPTHLWPTDAVREQTGHPLGGDRPDPPPGSER